MQLQKRRKLLQGLHVVQFRSVPADKVKYPDGEVFSIPFAKVRLGKRHTENPETLNRTELLVDVCHHLLVFNDIFSVASQEKNLQDMRMIPEWVSL